MTRADAAASARPARLAQLRCRPRALARRRALRAWALAGLAHTLLTQPQHLFLLRACFARHDRLHLASRSDARA